MADLPDNRGFGRGFEGEEEAEQVMEVSPPAPVQRPPLGAGSAGVSPARQAAPVDEVESVVGEDVPSGRSNVTGGVVRRKRRGIPGLAKNVLGGPVSKNYRTSAAVMFNNITEVFLDMVSPAYAQEIRERLFAQWGVPMDQPEATKFAEDLVLTFIIGSTASDKADYDREFEVPVKGGDGFVVASFAVLSRLLQSEYGVTRRQFARGIADEMKDFLKLQENTFMLPVIANRLGCEVQFAYLGFDGSTHCTGLLTTETQFAKTLEARNLFERDDVIAQGASDRLIRGMSSSSRPAR